MIADVTCGFGVRAVRAWGGSRWGARTGLRASGGKNLKAAPRGEASRQWVERLDGTDTASCTTLARDRRP
ncbi:hypothetical protein GCM10023108_14200 [Saccharopolyspora hordei]